MICFKSFSVGGMKYTTLLSILNSFRKFEFTEKLNVDSNSGELYLDDERSFVFKFERCKYSLFKSPIRWFFRDLFRKVFFLNLGSRSEIRSYLHVNSIGLKTPKVYSWGVFLNPLSDLSSFIIVEFKGDCISVREFLSRSAEDQKERIIVNLFEQIFVLSESGYIHKDCHLDNFLVDCKTGEIFWIDVHLKKVGFSKSLDFDVIKKSLWRIFEFNSSYEAIFIKLFYSRYGL